VPAEAPVDWSFKESWASTITAVGALFATIVSSTALPAATEVPKATWAGISFFFGVLVVVAPLVYAAFSKPGLYADRRIPASLPKPCREGKEELGVPAEPSSWRLL
jgi:hypothetical protein